MTQLLLINDKSYTDADNREIGDIVGVFDDTHVFSAKELEIFDVVQVAMDKTTISLLVPEVQPIFRSKTLDWTVDTPEKKNTWKDAAGDLKEIVERPRFVLHWDAAQQKITENYSKFIENETVIIAKGDLQAVEIK